MDLDTYQDEIGGISRYQIVVMVVTCCILFGQDMTSQAAIFISAVPEYRCAIPEFDEASACNLTEAEIKNLTIPYDGKTYSSCNRYAYNLSSCASNCDFSCHINQHGAETMGCDHGYIYDDSVYGETTTTQFNLVCDRRHLDTIAHTLFFFGFFVGSAAVGPLSDWFGRKKAMLVLVTGSVASGIALAFSNSYKTYAVVRFLSGTCCTSIYLAAYTYVCEMSNTKRRTATNLLINFSTASGHTIYAGFAYFIRNWHYLQITIALLPAPMFVMYYFLPESPRWLLANRKNEEARKVLERYAKSKGTILTEKTWQRILEMEESKSDTTKAATRKLKVWDLFRRPRMRIMCCNVMLSWFTVSMVFYRLALNGGNLAGEPYLNNAMNAIVEIFAYSSVYFSSIFGRRALLTFAFIMAGFSCLSSMLCSTYSTGIEDLLTASTVFAIMGKFFASLCFALIYIVTSEIFPTNARTTGLSLGSMAARVGCMLSPLILQIQTILPWFTQTVFGVLSIISGLCSLLYPETSNTEFLMTLDEAEEYYGKHAKIFHFCEKRKSYENSISSRNKIADDKNVSYSSYAKMSKEEQLDEKDQHVTPNVTIF